jgi:hypothetical protein
VVLRPRKEPPPQLVLVPKAIRNTSDPASPISLTPEINSSSLTPVYSPGKLYNSPIPLDYSQSRVEQIMGDKPSPATVLLVQVISDNVNRGTLAAMPVLAPTQIVDEESTAVPSPQQSIAPPITAIQQPETNPLRASLPQEPIVAPMPSMPLPPGAPVPVADLSKGISSTSRELVPITIPEGVVQPIGMPSASSAEEIAPRDQCIFAAPITAVQQPDTSPLQGSLPQEPIVARMPSMPPAPGPTVPVVGLTNRNNRISRKRVPINIPEGVVPIGIAPASSAEEIAPRDHGVFAPTTTGDTNTNDPRISSSRSSARFSRSAESVKDMIRQWSSGIPPHEPWEFRCRDGEYKNRPLPSPSPTSSTDEIATPLDEWTPIKESSNTSDEPQISLPSGSSSRNYPRTGLQPIQGNVSIASHDVPGVNIDSKAELCLPKIIMDRLWEHLDEIFLPLNGICQSQANLQLSVGYDLFPNATLEKSTTSVEAPGQGITLRGLN